MLVLGGQINWLMLSEYHKGGQMQSNNQTIEKKGDGMR